MLLKSKKSTLAIRCFIVLSIVMLSVLTTTSTIATSPTQVIIDQKTSDEIQAAETSYNNQKITSTTQEDNNSLNSTNFDFLALHNYLSRHYKDSRFAFQNARGYFTTPATFYGYMNLKMTGLEKYVIPSTSEIIKIYRNFTLKLRAPDLRGFAIHEDLDPSLYGTFSAISYLELMNRADYISNNLNSSDFINDQCKITINAQQVAFKEIKAKKPTLASTYYALKTLEILGTQISDVELTKVGNYIASTWQDTYFDDEDTKFEALRDSWFAVYSLTIIDQYVDLSQTDIAADYDQNLSTWINGQQNVTWGGIGMDLTNPTSQETGAALSILRKLDLLETTTINIPKATNFILASQYTNETTYQGHGGFSPNNKTHFEEYHYVSLDSTYWATLGLFSLDYFLNNSLATLQTEFFRTTSIQAKKFDLVQGEETKVYLKLAYDDTKSITAGIVEVISSDLNITVSETIQNEYLEQYYYEFDVGAPSSDWSLGNHSITFKFFVRNFTLFETTDREFTLNLNVRYGFSLPLPTGDNADGLLSPGETISFLVSSYNRSIEQEIVYQTYGSVNITLTSPTGDIIDLETVTHNWPEGENQTFINITLPTRIHLGQYKVKMEHFNASTIMSTSGIFISVKDNVYLGLIGGDRELKPGNPYTLNLTYYYQYSHKFPKDANISIDFVSSVSGETIFSEDLIFSAATYIVNSSQSVPNKIIMGSYNISSTVYWKRADGTYFTTPENAINSTLPLVRVVGNPVLIEDQNTRKYPFSERSTVYYGETMNITTKIGILLPNNEVINVNESISLRTEIINKSTTESLQFINSSLISEEYASFVGIVNPNILPGDYALRTQVLSRYNNSFIPILDNATKSIFRLNMSIAGTLQVNRGTLPVYNPLYTPTLITSFNITCVDSGKLVSGLKVIVAVKEMDVNQSSTIYGTNIFGDSYQLVIPIQDYTDGTYNATVIREVDGKTIGIFEFEVETGEIEEPIPIINYVASVLVLLLAILVLYNLYLRLFV